VYLLLILLLCVPAFGSDELARVIRAQTDFDRVEMSPTPQLKDTIGCVQAQAALLPITRPFELSLIHYRRGYCMLAGGILSRSRPDARQAASDFEKALEAWPQRSSGPPPVTLRILRAVALLWSGPDAAARSDIRDELENAVAQAGCTDSLMSPSACNALIETGRLWLGALALRQDRLDDAARAFRPADAAGWQAWVSGRQAFEARRFADAVPLFEKAAQLWSTTEKHPRPGVAGLFGPRPDLGAALEQLGAARLLSGGPEAAVAALSAAIKIVPERAWTWFLRARAQDALGREQDALSDYERASRLAFAKVEESGSSGAAHFYRGVWLYRRKDLERAESQFASALNFGPGDALRPDVLGWWRLVAVARGSCGESAERLEQSLGGVSDYFPKAEAQALLKACRRRTTSAGLE
jgi:tetratricopeptide (TPR) repeat protein